MAKILNLIKKEESQFEWIIKFLEKLFPANAPQGTQQLIGFRCLELSYNKLILKFYFYYFVIVFFYIFIFFLKWKLKYRKIIYSISLLVSFHAMFFFFFFSLAFLLKCIVWVTWNMRKETKKNKENSFI